MTSMFEIYGDENALLMYKYFDLHQIVSVTLIQVVIFVFQIHYVQILWMFGGFSILCFVYVGRMDFSPETHHPEQSLQHSA